MPSTRTRYLHQPSVYIVSYRGTPLYAFNTSDDARDYMRQVDIKERHHLTLDKVDYLTPTDTKTLDVQYTTGWKAADEAIQYKLCGYQDYSQGLMDWDRGWNARQDQEREREPR